MARFLLIDSLNTFMRCQHVVRADSSEQAASLAMMITINSVKAAWNRFSADHCVWALEGRSWRKDFYPEYKANRAVTRLNQSQKEVDDFKVMMEKANDLMDFVLNHTNCTVLRHSRCEADDFIARWIQIFSEDPTNEFIIVSSDSDFIQLLAPNVKIYDGVNNRIITIDGVFDDKMKPLRDKKGKLVEMLDPEYVLFEKCIRGDKSDNVASAYPGVRTKGSAKKVGIDEAFADRHNQGYAWLNFFKERWEDIQGKEHTVEDDYKRNQILIDLTMQPQDIKDALDITIYETLKEPKNHKHIGSYYLKFLGRHELTKLAENPAPVVQILNSGFKI